MKGGTLPQDDNNIPVQIGNYIQTYDATGTPNKSPEALADVSNLEIIFPERAAKICIKCSVSLKIGSAAADVQGTGNGYVTSEADLWWKADVGHSGSIFVRNESGGSVNVEFYFVMI